LSALAPVKQAKTVAAEHKCSKQSLQLFGKGAPPSVANYVGGRSQNLRRGGVEEAARRREIACQIM